MNDYNHHLPEHAALAATIAKKKIETITNTKIKKIIFINDNAAGQYKSAATMAINNSLSYELDCEIEEIFNAPQHGKGPIDAVGALFKVPIRSAIYRREIVSVTCWQDCVDYLETRKSKVERWFYELVEKDVLDLKKKHQTIRNSSSTYSFEGIRSTFWHRYDVRHLRGKIASPQDVPDHLPIKIKNIVDSDVEWEDIEIKTLSSTIQKSGSTVLRYDIQDKYD